ncbi:MAG: hypothetical protein JWP97_6406 [Labilithrix sp.]|nr:hypothetical protein [Labilithrix sp.]
MSDNKREGAFFVSAISDELSCAELTRLIGLPPDEGWSKGDAYERAGQPRTYKFTRWALVVRAAGPENDWEEAIDTLFARVRPVKEGLKRLPAEVAIKLEVDLTEDWELFGFGMSPEQVAFAAEIRAMLDMSFVVSLAPSYAPPPET